MEKTSTVATVQTGKLSFWQQFREDIECVFGRDPAARSHWEVITTYPGIHAILIYRAAHVLWKRNWRYSARLLSFISRLITHIEIHPGASIGRRFFIDHGSGVVIGETTVIGDDCTLYHGVTLGGTTWNPGKRHPTLEDGVVVGAGAKILGAITIGKNVRVGANSVVFADVPAGMTVVGIPGRIVLPLEKRRITPQGIDLDHHLMPDPVGKAITCLIDRINQLEIDLESLRQATCPPSLPKQSIELDLAGVTFTGVDEHQFAQSSVEKLQ